MELKTNRYDTDKSVGFLRVYEKFFSPIKNEKVNLLEVGVYKGGSLLLWRDYFPNGNIVGIDINHVVLEDNSRITCYQGSQDDLMFLENVAKKEVNSTGFDIIIDDASHIGKLTKTTFWYLFDNHLKNGGIYVIEDWGTGYWRDWPDGRRYKGKNHCYGMVKFIKELVDECGMADITNNKANKLLRRESKFESILIAPGQVVVIKSLKCKN